MKTIEEQAREYADKVSKLPDGDWSTKMYEAAEAAFLAGTKAATRWISVEEELPLHDQRIICISNRGIPKYTFGSQVLWDNKLIQEERKDPNYLYWKYWLPIPPIPEK